MEVGQQPADDSELVARIDIKRRLSLYSLTSYLPPNCRRALQGAKGGGADGDDPPALGCGPLYPLTTSIILSSVLTVLLNIFIRR